MGFKLQEDQEVHWKRVGTVTAAAIITGRRWKIIHIRAADGIKIADQGM